MKRMIALAFVLSFTANAALLDGGAGLSFQVYKFLLDHGVDPAQSVRDGKLRILADEAGEHVTQWDIADVAVPDLAQLESVESASAFLALPEKDRVFSDGTWRKKTEAEQAATPAGAIVVEQKSLTQRLGNELRAAGFTNKVFSSGDVYRWLDSSAATNVTAQQEKKITRILTRIEQNARPEIRITLE